MDELLVLRDIATGPLAGPSLLAGVIAATVVVLSKRVAAGPALAVAVGAAAWSLGRASWLVLAGVVGVALRDHLEEGEGWQRIAALLVGAAGAGLVAVRLYPAGLEVVVALLAALVLPVVLAMGEGGRAARALGGRLDGLLLLGSLYGIWSVVADGDLAVVALAAAVPIAVLSQIRAGAAASLAIVVVIAASGGASSTTGLIAALGCLGVLLLPNAEEGPWWGQLLVHAAVVYVVSRVAPQRESLVASLIVAAALLLAAVILPRLPRGR